MSDVLFKMDRNHLKVEIKKLSDEETPDSDYWLSKSIDERVAALEFLRRIAHPGYDGNTSRLQRVYSVIKRKSR